MRNYKKITVYAGLFVGMLFGFEVMADPVKPLYENNFEQAKVDAVPDDFLVLDGGFTVKEDGGNKFLELPGEPLDSFAVLFGPTVKSNVVVSARVFATKKGRRFPTFAVGLNGQHGFRLQVSPAKDALEIYKGDEVLTNAPYEWKSGEWTMLALQLSKSGEEWKVSGKSWTQGTPEPAQAMISFGVKDEPPTGRASVWGSPFATTPIRFDDLRLWSVEAEK